MNTNNFEIKCGIVIAIFAAVMALSDMFAGKYGEDEIKFINEKSSAFMWYQAKSIRETVIEGQRDLINTLIEGKSISDNSALKLRSHTDKLSKKIEKYGKEKNEILRGSSQVGEANWVQDVGGKLGQVVGALEYQKKIEILGSAGDLFDLSNLFFQVCLVMGAISLVLTREKLREVFFYIMISLGLLGSTYSVMALNIAIKA